MSGDFPNHNRPIIAFPFYLHITMSVLVVLRLFTVVNFHSVPLLKCRKP